MKVNLLLKMIIFLRFN